MDLNNEGFFEQPQQKQGEPVAWMRWDDEEKYYDVRRTTPTQENIDYLAKWNRPAWHPLYTTPQQRKPLTDEQIEKLMDNYDVASLDYARAIEAAHGIGAKE